jgi:hypothetical protein
MWRTFYTLAVLALIGGSAWAATGLERSDRTDFGSGVGIVLLAALQR